MQMNMHVSRSSQVFVEALESRRLLSAAPVPNALGLYTGTVNFPVGPSDSLTVTITSQHNRSFSGSFAQGSGTTARLQGNIAANGVMRFTYRGTGFTGRGTGSLDPSGTVIDATFLTRKHGMGFSGDFEVRLQGTRPAVPTIPQLAGSRYMGGITFSDGSSDSLDLTITSQRNKNFAGRYSQGSGSQAVFTGTVDVNGAMRFRFQGAGRVRFHGSGSGTVSNGNQRIDATFTTQQPGKTLTGSFSIRRVTG